MARKHFYELLNNRIINPNDEAIRLHNLFSEERVLGGQSLEDYIDYNFFRQLKIRSTYTSIKDLRKDLRVSKLDFITYNPLTNVSIDKLFLFSELLLCIFSECRKFHLSMSDRSKEYILIIEDNITKILDKTNFKSHLIEQDTYIIVEKNNTVSEAVEYIDDENIAIAAIEYNHYILKGNLEEKQTILRSLGHYIEPLLKEHKLHQNGYKDLESDIGFLLNNFNIRHNNKSGNAAKTYIVSMNDSILEEWYDKTYNSILSAIIISTHIDIHNELSLFKQNNNL